MARSQSDTCKDSRKRMSLQGECTEIFNLEALSLCNRYESTEGVTMDDLDHSIHIAEYDWTSFFEECEECSLLQPSLADIDNSSLSDSEDSGSLAYPVSDTVQHEVHQNTAANTGAFQTNSVGLSIVKEHRTGFTTLSMQSCTEGGQPDDLKTEAEEDSVRLRNLVALANSLGSLGDSEICPLPAKVVQIETTEQITEVTNYSITNHVQIAQQTGCTNVHCSASDGAYDASICRSTDMNKRDGDVRGESDTFNLTTMQEPEPLICNEKELNKNVPYNTESVLCEKDSAVAHRTEKERWFVTVNDSPLQQRFLDNATVKKKQRKKKPFRNINRMCRNGPEPWFERGPKLEISKTNEFDGEDMEQFTQSYQNSGAQTAAEILLESFHGEVCSESHQIYMTSSPSGEEENVAQKLEMSPFAEAVPTESCVDSNKCEPFWSVAVSLEDQVNLPTSTLPDAFTFKGENTKSLDSIESEDFEEGVECFSTSSFESENYLSAAESTEEPQDPIQKHPVDIKQLSQTCPQSLTTPNSRYVLTEPATAHNTQETEMYSCDIKNVHFSTLSNDATVNLQLSLQECSPSTLPQQHEGYESNSDRAYVEPTITCPPTSQRNNTTSEDNSTSDNDTHSHAPLDTRELPEHKLPTDFLQLSASGSLERDQFRSPPPAVPDLTVTPCSVVDSPEAYVEPLGPSRPVYAISTFWDEMEKLTIKDILQLRVARSPSPRETHNIQETERPQGDVTDIQTPNSSLGDTAEFLLPDGALVETSDTADSDYFTHLDDSKPDRSSCEFSTFSDFDEEYWQFAGASRDSSPDPHDINQQSQRTTCDLQIEDTEPVGKETAVAVEKCFDDHTLNIFLSSEPACPRRITKSKSMQNVQALNTEIQLKDAPLQSILENAENGLLPSNQSLEENNFWKVCDNIMLTRRTPAPILSNTDILDENYRITFPEVFEYLFLEDDPKNNSRSDTVYDSEDMSVAEAYDYTLSPYGSEMSLSSIQDSECSEGKPIPIFSCSHSTVRDLTFPELDYLFFPLDTYDESEEVDDSSPIRVVSRSHFQANDTVFSSSAPGEPLKRGWSSRWKSLLSIRKCFPDRGSSWCRRSGAWVFPVEAQRTPVKRPNPAITMFSERKAASFPSQFFRDLAAQQRMMKSIQTTLSLSNQEGLFSTLKQSDMCLVCIAVASWVLRSSDPQAADTWKAALLANVSAISAIQYLRQYVKKDSPQDEP